MVEQGHETPKPPPLVPAMPRRARRWASRGVWLGALAAGVGGLGEAVLLQAWGRGLGTVLLVGAALLAGLAWGDLRVPPATPVPEQNVVGPSALCYDRRGLIVRLAGI